MPLTLYLLAMAVFAMSTSEFMLAGLLPEIAGDLDVSVGTTGLLTSAFAIGMACGAPLMAALARGWPARNSLLGFVLLFATVHIVGALTSSFAVLLTTRVIAACANAGFLAVALATTTTLAGSHQKGRALAVLLSGTTVAMIAGVPGGALLGSLLGWRATFWAVAFACLPAAAGVLKGIPAHTTNSSTTTLNLRAEIRHLAKPALASTMLLAALFNAATFSTFTYLAPIVTGTADMDGQWVSVALVLFGLGSFLGVQAAGRLSDRRSGHTILVAGPALLLGWIALAMLAADPVALLTLVFAQGMLSFALGSTLIARVLYAATAAATMGGSYATAALNVGAAAGPLLAAGTLGSGNGQLGPVWISSLLVAMALTLALSWRRFISAGVPIRR